MSRKINFEFNCTESSSSFIRSGDNEYCLKCAKTVIDLRDKTQFEVEKLIEGNNGSICGKFHMDQFADRQMRKKRIKSPLFLSALAAFLTFSAGKTQAQGKMALARTEQLPAIDVNNYAGIQDTLTNSDSSIISDGDSCEKLKIHRRYPKTEKKMYRIGKNYYFFSWRLPFIHKRHKFIKRGGIKFL